MEKQTTTTLGVGHGSDTNAIPSTTSTSPGLSWHDVSFSIRTGSGKNASQKKILDSISGYCRKGELTGIIGPSGSGKTTLLNVLTGRAAAKAKIDGTILFEGRKREKSSWKRTVGYVEQFDLMYDSLTCRETLIFAAMTRLPRSWGTKRKLNRADEVLESLGLEKARDTWVGGENKSGASGGERKRVAVGCELLNSPRLLCLDECTSGLDSHSAFTVISTLHQISRSNVAVLCTIHQPSFEIFSQFDTVILIALGRIAFEGTIPDAIAHFEKLGYPLPQGANAADHFIGLLTEPGSKEGISDAERNRVRHLLEVWSDKLEEQFKDQSLAGKQSQVGNDSPSDVNAHKFGLDYPQELYWLVKRAWIQQVRSPENFVVGIGQSLVMSIILGFTFFRLGLSQGDVLGRAGLLFFIPIFNTFGILFPIIQYLPLYNGILIKERRTGAYRVSTYLLSRYSVEIPVAIASRLLFFILIYWMCNFRPQADAFFIFLAMNCFTILLAITMGLFIGSLSANVAVIQAVAPVLNVLFVLFGGFLLPLPSIPVWFVWIHWISYMTYVFAALCINELKALVFECAVADSGQCYVNGQIFLDKYGLERFTIGENFGLLAAITIAFAVLGYAKLSHLTRPNLRLD